MDFKFTEKEEAFRNEVEDFLLAELPKSWTENSLTWPAGYGLISMFEAEFESFCRDFWQKLGKKGWLSLGWPNWPDTCTQVEHAIFNERTSYYSAPAGNVATGIGASTISLFASEEMKKEWLPRIAAGELSFWLAYSEPNSGSDLASLNTKAVEDGDSLVINGSKIWSSGAHISDCAWMVVRTDSTSDKKYHGITFVIVPNETPGITMRPIVNICGVHSFNEVFFEDVRVPKKNIVGEMNKGWYYLMVALEYERLAVPLGGLRRTMDQLIDYAKKTERKGKPISKDPIVRDKLANLEIKLKILERYYWQTAWKSDHNIDSGTDASIMKLVSTEFSKDLAHTAMEILGPIGQLTTESKFAPLNGRMQLGYLDCISALVGAGTSEIQRNIIAMRGLGLPRK